MRHRKKGKKLGVNPSHRKSMLMNLANNLIEHGKIKTTDSKAKALRMYIEPLITKAKCLKQCKKEVLKWEFLLHIQYTGKSLI